MTSQLAIEFSERPTLTVKRGTILDRVLDMLLEKDWVTTSEFLNAGLYTFRNRTSELNVRFRERHEPEPILCEKMDNGEWRYRLIYDPRRR